MKTKKVINCIDCPDMAFLNDTSNEAQKQCMANNYEPILMKNGRPSWCPHRDSIVVYSYEKDERVFCS